MFLTTVAGQAPSPNQTIHQTQGKAGVEHQQTKRHPQHRRPPIADECPVNTCQPEDRCIAQQRTRPPRPINNNQHQGEHEANKGKKFLPGCSPGVFEEDFCSPKTVPVPHLPPVAERIPFLHTDRYRSIPVQAVARFQQSHGEVAVLTRDEGRIPTTHGFDR